MLSVAGEPQTHRWSARASRLPIATTACLMSLCAACGRGPPDVPELGPVRAEHPLDATVAPLPDAESADTTMMEVGAEASVDASAEAALEGGTDGAPDADSADTTMMEVGAEASVDASAEAAPEGGTDVAPDASRDASRDVDAPDAFPCVYRTPPAASASVLQFHKNPSRDGVYVDPAFTPTAIPAMQVRFAVPMTGQVYAQPLYVADGQNNRELFVAATEANHVTVVDGCGQPVWDHTYGTPAAYADLPCGNIYPALGITGLRYRRCFAHHLLRRDDTARKWYREPAALHPCRLPRRWIGEDRVAGRRRRFRTRVRFVAPEPARRAAALSRDALRTVRRPLRGLRPVLWLDCRGAVSKPASPHAWRTIGDSPWEAGAPISGGGFWAVGGLSTDGMSLFAVSGNTMDPSDAGQWNAPPTWVGGETVFRLDPGPSFSNASTDSFRPADWQSLDDSDQDLGSASVVPFDVGAAHYLVAMDKRQYLYVLNRDDLGAPPVASINITNCGGGCGVIGAPLVYTTSQGTYIAVPEHDARRDEVLFLHGDPPTFTAPPGVSDLQAGLGVAIATTTDGASNFFIWTASYGSLGAEVGNGNIPLRRRRHVPA